MRTLAFLLFGAMCVEACTSHDAPGGADAEAPSTDADPLAPDARGAATADAASSPPDAAGPPADQCDPVTQKAPGDGAGEYCGAPLDADGHQQAQCAGNPAGSGQHTTFACTDVGFEAYALGHDRQEPSGQFLDVCAPGSLPLQYDAATERLVCVALCTPAPTWQGNSADEAGVAPLPLSANHVASPTEECRYWWRAEDPAATPGYWSDYLGYAVDPAAEGVARCDELDHAAAFAAGCGPRGAS